MAAVPDGLNDRPWFPIATVEPGTRECTVNLKQFPQELIWHHQDHRFAVSTVGGLGLESELVETLAPPKN